MKPVRRVVILLFILAISVTASADDLRILARDVPLEAIPSPYNWANDAAYRNSTSLDFHVDLDLLAPLGEGDQNAAIFFKDFAKNVGERSDEVSGMTVGVKYDDVGVGYAFDAPFVLESEKWIENRSMSFYPAVWGMEGPGTKIPNLLFFLKLGRTWIAKGNVAEAPASAIEEYRRVIRLGRLVRQDDVTLIQDLIGIALIRMGAEAIYEVAREQGDAKAMLICALAMQDVAGIRNQTKYRLKNLLWGDESEEAPILSFRRWFGAEVEQDEFDQVHEIATQSADRRLRFEGIESLGYIVRSGESKYAKKAREALSEISKSDPDDLVRELAKWHLADDAS